MALRDEATARIDYYFAAIGKIATVNSLSGFTNLAEAKCFVGN
jgi:hypothetical protein